MSGQTNVRNLDGSQGSQYASGTGPHTGDFFAIQFIAESTISAITAPQTDNASTLVSDAVAFAKGDVLYLPFTSITFSAAAAKAILYKK
jgi:hypothetical protein